MEILTEPWRKNGKMNPARYKQYYETHKVAIRKRQNALGKKYKSSLRSMDYRTMMMSLLWERDKGICGICTETIIAVEDAGVDHIKLRSHGGSNEADNLRLVHRQCNLTRSRGKDNG